MDLAFVVKKRFLMGILQIEVIVFAYDLTADFRYTR